MVKPIRGPDEGELRKLLHPDIEESIKEAADQGILLEPRGSHGSDPFRTQDPVSASPTGSTVAKPDGSNSTEESTGEDSRKTK